MSVLQKTLLREKSPTGKYLQIPNLIKDKHAEYVKNSELNDKGEKMGIYLSRDFIKEINSWER